MTGTIWQAGDSEELSCTLLLNDSGGSRFFNNTDGYGKWWAWVERGNGREYLQSSLITINPTKHEFDLTFDGTRDWDDDIDFVVPPIFSGENVYVVKALYWSDGTLARAFTEEHYCTLADLDDIEQQVIGPGEKFVPDYGG